MKHYNFRTKRCSSVEEATNAINSMVLEVLTEYPSPSIWWRVKPRVVKDSPFDGDVPEYAGCARFSIE